MSILIEGIDLPENRNGSIKIRIYGSGRVWADKTLVGQAIQIDRPHGRLIDETEVKKNSIDDDYDLYVSWTEIDKTPTILEAEGRTYTIQADSETVSYKNGENQF